MPTKPSPAVSPRWNTSAANQVTPSGGKIALGWEPSEDPSSSYFNWFMFETGEITNWVLDGTSDPDEDAHIVESDAAGIVAVAQLDVVAGASATFGIDVTVAATNIPGISATGGGGANGNGANLRGGSGASYGAACVGGTGGGAGLFAQGTGGGWGIECLGGEDPGAHGAVISAGGGSAGAGVVAQGDGVSAGVVSLGGAIDGSGLQGTCGGTGGYGVDGRTAASATTAAAGVRGNAVGDGTGVLAQAVDGYGLIASSDTSVPARAAVRIVPQNNDPSTALDGDICMQDDDNVTELRLRLEGAWRSAMWRTSGQCYAAGTAAGPVSDSSAVYQTMVSASFGAPLDPKRTGLVRIRVSGEVGRGTSSDANIEIRVRDTTAGADALPARIVELFQAAGTYERDVSWEGLYTIPAAGARTFEVQIRRSSGSGTVAMRNALIVIDGVF